MSDAKAAMRAELQAVFESALVETGKEIAPAGTKSLLEREIAERDAAQRECSRLREEVRRAEADRDAAATGHRVEQDLRMQAEAERDEARREVQAERDRAHTLVCNYRHGPFGGPGCICVVTYRRDMEEMRAAEARVAALEAEVERLAAERERISLALPLGEELPPLDEAVRRIVSVHAALSARVEALAEDVASWAARWRRMVRGEEGVWSEDARRALLVSVVAVEHGCLEPLRALLLSPPAAATPAPQTAEQGTRHE